MPSTAFIIGFFTALGWISAYKLVAIVDEKPTEKATSVKIESLSNNYYKYFTGDSL